MQLLFESFFLSLRNIHPVPVYILQLTGRSHLQPHPFTGAQVSTLPFLEDAEPSPTVSIKSLTHTHPP